MLQPKPLARGVPPVVSPPLPEAILDLLWIHLRDPLVPLQPAHQTSLGGRRYPLRRLDLHRLSDLGGLQMLGGGRRLQRRVGSRHRGPEAAYVLVPGGDDVGRLAVLAGRLGFVDRGQLHPFAPRGGDGHPLREELVPVPSQPPPGDDAGPDHCQGKVALEELDGLGVR